MRNDAVQLELRDLKCGYGTVVVVEPLSTRFYAGTLTLILGVNAAGKTTLLRTLSGILRPIDGTYLLNGVDGEDSPRRPLPGEVSILPQGAGVFPSLSVRDNLIASAAPAGGMKDARARASVVLDSIPILKRMPRRQASKLSVGMQRILAFGNAVCRPPRVLLLDEPTAGLAADVAQDIMGMARRMADEGCILLVSEHRIDKVSNLTDRVCVFSEGQLSYDGPPSILDDPDQAIQAALRSRRVPIGSPSNASGTNNT